MNACDVSVFLHLESAYSERVPPVGAEAAPLPPLLPPPPELLTQLEPTEPLLPEAGHCPGKELRHMEGQSPAQPELDT